MNIAPAAKRYADALFSLAQETHVLDVVKDDLDRIADLVSGSEDLATFVDNPLLKPTQQKAVLDATFKQGANGTTHNFLHFLCDKERLALLPGVCSVFKERYLEEKGILNVQVVSARKLSAQQVERLTAKLATQHGKEIWIHETVDDALIGGFTVQVGDEITDHSVAAQLAAFKKL